MNEMPEEGKYYLYDRCHVVTFTDIRVIYSDRTSHTMYYMGGNMSSPSYVREWHITNGSLYEYIELNNDIVITDDIRERIIKVAEYKNGRT